MNATVKSLGLDRLTIEERLALVEELWDSIAESSVDVPLSNAQRAELDRRLAERSKSRRRRVVGRNQGVNRLSPEEMKRRVVFRRAARVEFDTAALRYDLQKPGLGTEFV